MKVETHQTQCDLFCEEKSFSKVASDGCYDNEDNIAPLVTDAFSDDRVAMDDLNTTDTDRAGFAAEAEVPEEVVNQTENIAMLGIRFSGFHSHIQGIACF